ncbi:MAG TPA: lamin tail domain-containing protein [Candidatus Paceibacterota bacterium]|jgi:hypothetical protein
MSEAWFVVAIFLFAFVLWVSTGGPSRPISFSGPFITPITDVGDTQEAYGDMGSWGVDDSSPNSSFWSTRTFFGRFEGTLNEDNDIGAAPPVGRVLIAEGASDPTESDVTREQITIRAEGGAVDITGWRLVSSRGDEAVIPRAANGMAILLQAGDEAVVTTGSSSRGNARDGVLWRIFLGQRRELWRNNSDTIELIDRTGRTVDIYSY